MLQNLWKDKKYLIIDEYSTISKSFLAKIAENSTIGKQGFNHNLEPSSFGGLDVILCGDLHQFLPVAKSPWEYLYRATDLSDDLEDCKLGRAIYEEFTTFVILKEQKQVTDRVWHRLLTNLRKGQVQQSDLSTLHDLVIGTHRKPADDFSHDHWATAPLVTPRHGVRNLWNEHSTRKWRRLYVCTAEDMIGTRQLTSAERFRVSMRQKTHKTLAKKDLPSVVELANGMNVLVTSNIETDLDITNGA